MFILFNGITNSIHQTQISIHILFFKLCAVKVFEKEVGLLAFPIQSLIVTALIDSQIYTPEPLENITTVDIQLLDTTKCMWCSFLLRITVILEYLPVYLFCGKMSDLITENKHVDKCVLLTTNTVVVDVAIVVNPFLLIIIITSSVPTTAQ